MTLLLKTLAALCGLALNLLAAYAILTGQMTLEMSAFVMTFGIIATAYAIYLAEWEF